MEFISLPPTLRYVNKICGSKLPHAFPGSMPIPMFRKHIFDMVRFPYTITKKADGERLLLVCVHNKVYFMNRKCEFHELCECHDIYNDTVIDGEYISNETSTQFLIFDVLAYQSKKVCRMKQHANRLNVLFTTSILKKLSDDTGIQLSMKEFVPLDHYANGTEFSDNRNDFESDGYIFMPMYGSIHFGTDTRIFKWKSPENITCDFKYQPSTGSLCVWDSGIMSDVTVGKLSKEEEYLTDGCIIECSYVRDNIWNLTKIRADKSRSNSHRTYAGTLQAIQENISIEDIINTIREKTSVQSHNENVIKSNADS